MVRGLGMILNGQEGKYSFWPGKLCRVAATVPLGTLNVWGINRRPLLIQGDLPGVLVYAVVEKEEVEEIPELKGGKGRVVYKPRRAAWEDALKLHKPKRRIREKQKVEEKKSRKS